MKYHLGTSFDRPTSSGKRVHISLLANPSHLEAVNTVVLGKARARQYYEGDTEGRATMPVLLHGDGAFSGQVRPAPAPTPGKGGSCVRSVAGDSGIHTRPVWQ